MIRRRPSRRPLFASAALLALAPLAPASEFATSIVQSIPGPFAHPAFPPARLLGGPQGGGAGVGSLDVHMLGVGGSVTVGFDVILKDGPGADFLAFENPISAGGGSFSEAVFVEVSSDGSTFARFPSRYVGPALTQPALGTLPIGTFAGLSGHVPVMTNVATNSIPPEDPVRAGGEAFDLAELANDPLVVSGAVDVMSIKVVRFVDVPEGLVTDSGGNPIFDHGGPSGSADMDAVCVVNHTMTVTPNQPICDLRIDPLGFLEVEFGDPDGFCDLDLSALRASFNLVEFPFFAVFPAFSIVSFDGNVALLRSLGPVTGAGIMGAFAVSAGDFAGGFSGDQILLQG